MNLPRITVVTPSYNQAPFLEATISSVLGQRYPDLEYIVMDGGSNDGSVEIIKKYERRLTHWESGPDNGQADAILKGFSRSTGQILCWLNSDDLYLPGCLESVGKYYLAHPDTECVVGGCVFIGSNGSPFRDRLGLPRCNLGSNVTYSSLHLGRCGFMQPSSFFRRNAFFEVRGFDASLVHCFDLDLYLRLAARQPFGRIREFLTCFRLHPQSKTSTLENVRLAEDAMLFERHPLPPHAHRLRRLLRTYYQTRWALSHRMLQLALLCGVRRMAMPSGLYCAKGVSGQKTSHSRANSP